MDCSILFLSISERVPRTDPYRRQEVTRSVALGGGTRAESTERPRRLGLRGKLLPRESDTASGQSRAGRAGRPGNLVHSVTVSDRSGASDQCRYIEWRLRGKNLVSAADTADFYRSSVGPKHVASSCSRVSYDYEVCDVEGTAQSYRETTDSAGGEQSRSKRTVRRHEPTGSKPTDITMQTQSQTPTNERRTEQGKMTETADIHGGEYR
jgi:hypothetical protein